MGGVCSQAYENWDMQDWDEEDWDDESWAAEPWVEGEDEIDDVIPGTPSCPPSHTAILAVFLPSHW